MDNTKFEFRLLFDLAFAVGKGRYHQSIVIIVVVGRGKYHPHIGVTVSLTVVNNFCNSHVVKLFHFALYREEMVI